MPASAPVPTPGTARPRRRCRGLPAALGAPPEALPVDVMPKAAAQEVNPFEGPLDLGIDRLDEPSMPSLSSGLIPASGELATPSMSSVNIPLVDDSVLQFQVENYLSSEDSEEDTSQLTALGLSPHLGGEAWKFPRAGY